MSSPHAISVMLLMSQCLKAVRAWMGHNGYPKYPKQSLGYLGLLVQGFSTFGPRWGGIASDGPIAQLGPLGLTAPAGKAGVSHG